MTHRSERIAVYPGSFNPLTKGHLDILSRVLRLFDRVVIAVGCNIHKPGSEETAKDILKHLEQLFDGYARIKPMVYTGLTADLVKDLGASCIVRGVRGNADFDYERSLADTNAAIANVETIMLAARPDLSFISSSMIRELRHFGHDTTEYEVSREDVVKTLGFPTQK